MTHARSGCVNTSTWLPVGEGYLHAVVHQPGAAGSSVRGSVVLAPPLGREQVVTFPALRILAAELVDEGYVVVRFDWRGTGDSSGLDDPDAAASMVQDLDAAIDLARAVVPRSPVHVVGLRLGAAVAAVTTHPDVGCRVLWEAVTGRAFVRAQTALRRLSVEMPVVSKDQGVEFPGLFLTKPQAASVGRLQVPREAPSGWHLVTESDPRVAETLHSVESVDARVPRQSVRDIVGLLPVGRFETHPVRRRTTVTSSTGVTEELVEVGHNRLPGVLTYPAAAEVAHAVAFTAPAAEPRSGPSGLWSTVARELSRRGTATLRADRRGTGELTDVSVDLPPNPYTDETVSDTVDTVTYLTKRFPTEVTGVGLCLGAWALLAAGKSAPGLRQIVAYNNVAWNPRPSFYRLFYTRRQVSQAMRSEELGDTQGGPVSTRRALFNVARAAKRAVAPRWSRLVASSPARLWRGLARLNLAQDPGMILRPLPSDIGVTLVFGPLDESDWRAARGPEALESLRSRDCALVVEYTPSLDHACLSEGARRWLGSHIVGLVNQCAEDAPTDRV